MDSLDPKKSIKFIASGKKPHHLARANSYMCGNSLIWVIEDFLTEHECNEIIEASCTAGFESIEDLYSDDYRQSKRIVAFDENNALSTTIEKRLCDDKLLERINSPHKKVVPYGAPHIEWDSYTGEVNKCYRINQYVSASVGFDWHRDSQYTQSDTTRSGYSIVVYLNDYFHGGETEFMTSKAEPHHAGLTVEEELCMSKGENRHVVKPKTGRAVIFDQRILHKAHPIVGAGKKYVLRTDLILHGKVCRELTENEANVIGLTKQLFRQAQYYELECIGKKDATLIKKAQQLYEICLSLRQTPDKIKYEKIVGYKLLVTIPAAVPISSVCAVVCFGRTGGSYKFSADTSSLSYNQKLAMIRRCALFSMLTYTSTITYEELLANWLDEQDNARFTIVSDEPENKPLVAPTDYETDDSSSTKSEDKPTAAALALALNEKLLTMYSNGQKIDVKLKELCPELIPTHFKGAPKTDLALTIITTANYHRCETCGLGDSTPAYFEAYTYESSVLKNEHAYTLSITVNRANTSKMEGYIRIRTAGKAKTFNHACCQCEDLSDIDISTSTVYTSVQIEQSFTLSNSNDELTIRHIPNVVL